MRLLVTGGAGYIGGAFIRAARDAGHEPVVLDNLSTGHRDAVPADIELHAGDIRQRDLLDKLLKRCDAVVHFAALSIVGDSVADPVGYYRENLGSFLALLEALRESPVRKLIFSSSAAVYGHGEGRPFREEDPCRPVNPYGGTKLAMEQTLEHVAPALGLDWMALRYFNAAGSVAGHGERHDPETHLIPLALRALVSGEPLKIFGNDYDTPDGSCVRDYIHIEDLASAHLRALERLGGDFRTALNLGSGRGYSVLEVLEMAEKVAGRPVPAVQAPRRQGDPDFLVAAVDKARSLLDWRSEKSDLEGILQSAWEFHEKNH